MGLGLVLARARARARALALALVAGDIQLGNINEQLVGAKLCFKRTTYLQWEMERPLVQRELQLYTSNQSVKKVNAQTGLAHWSSRKDTPGRLLQRKGDRGGRLCRKP